LITIIKQKVYKGQRVSPADMNSTEFLEKIKGLQKPVFTSNDLQKLSGFDKKYLKVYLFRLKQHHRIQEVEKGKYALPLHPFIIASNVIFPTYISFFSAYFYHDLTTQMPNIIQIVSLRSKKRLKGEGYTIQFIKMSPFRVFGYTREKFMEKYIFVAEKEKAIIDSLYLPECCPLEETYIALQGDLNVDLLITYALRMKSIILLKRLGYLLELRGIDIFIKIKSKLNNRYDYLNPRQHQTGKKSKKWRLVINIQF